MTQLLINKPFVDALIDRIALAVASKLHAPAARAAARKPRDGRSPSPMKGKHLTAAQMRCRALACRKRSLGPRAHYLCARHLARRHVRLAA